MLTAITFSAAVAFFIISGIFVYSHIDYKRQIENGNKQDMRTLSRNAKLGIENILNKTMNNADALADSLSHSKFTQKLLLNRLENIIKNNPEFYGATISFCPFGYDPGRRLYAPYFCRNSESDGDIKLSQIENTYDYTIEAPEHNWYLNPLKNKKCWSEPYWGPAGRTYMVTYSSAFYRYDSIIAKKVPLGVVAIDISLDCIKNIIEKTDLGPGGFGALVSGNGTYLYHPDKDYVISHKTLLQVAFEKTTKTG